MSILEKYPELGQYLIDPITGDSVPVGVKAFFLFVVIFFGFRLFRRIVISRLEKFAKKTDNQLDDVIVDVIQDLPGLFYFLVAAYFPLKMVVYSEEIEKWIDIVFVVAIVYYAVRLVQKVVEYVLSVAFEKGAKKANETTFTGIRILLKIVLWSSAFLLVLSNLGVNVSSLIASLGIGGIAVALAVQNILGDIFSSFTIYFDKPFEVGDFIMLDPVTGGTVKKIGLKTTRLETLQGEELIVSNNELTSAKIQNFKKMTKRRVLIIIGLEYSTVSKKLRKVNEIVKKAVDNVDGTEFARSHFKEFGDSSLNFEVVYYVLSPDYADFMDKNEEVNFNIREHFEKEKLEFAFPTQTVYVRK